MLLVDQALKADDAQETLVAAAMLLQFDLMARPGGVCAMDSSWIFSVKHKFSASTGLVVFYPGDAGARDKSKQQGDAVGVGELTKQFWLADLLRALARRFPSGPMLRLELHDYKTTFEKLRHRANLGSLQMVPHGLRHGAESYMSLQMKTFDWQAIQTRGRWRSAASVMTYKKACSYVRQLSRLATDQRAKAQSVVSSLQRRMTGRLIDRRSRR